MGDDTAAVLQRPNTHEMVVVHRVFRREFRLLPQMVRATAVGDVAAAARVARHAEELLTALHHHHTGEDELLWPRLRERAEMDVELVNRMERQHETVAILIQQVQGVLPAWRASASVESRDHLHALFLRVSAALEEHLRDEEQHVLPVVESHISVQEWAELGERGMASMPRDRVVVFLGAILEEASAEESAEFLAKVPLPGRLAYQLLGRRRYAREMNVLRQGVTVPRQRRG